MKLPGQRQGFLGQVIPAVELAQLVACPDCASEMHWKFMAPGVFQLLICHDNTCPSFIAQQRGNQS